MTEILETPTVAPETISDVKIKSPYGLEEPCRVSDDEHKKGMISLASALVVFGLCSALTYVVPAAARFRPWVPGEPLPVVALYQRRPAEASPSFVPSTSTAAEAETRVAGNDLPEERVTPIVTHGEDTQFTLSAAEFDGVRVPIEDSSGHAMDAFFESLKRTAQGQDQAITRVAHFGDSSIALDGITETVRERLQQRFGDAGHGFVLFHRGSMPYRHKGIRHDGEGSFRLYDITHLSLGDDGRYGLGGAQSRSSSGGMSWFETAESDAVVGSKVSRVELLFQRYARGGDVSIRVDGGQESIVSTRGDVEADEAHRIDLPDGPHRIEFRTRGHGESRFYGVVFEREGPGVVYDSLGMVGARASRMLGFTEQHLRDQLALRQTNLVVIGFGGNDADDRRSTEDFQNDFARVARLARRARPEASCLLFAPLDQAERDERGDVRTLPAVPRIVEAMRRAAASEGCAFYDTFAAMGGNGSMGRWFRGSPRLATGDFRHATPLGYRRVGTDFERALLLAFAHYLQAEGSSAGPSSVGDASASDASIADGGIADGGAPDATLDAGVADAGDADVDEDPSTPMPMRRIPQRVPQSAPRGR